MVGLLDIIKIWFYSKYHETDLVLMCHFKLFLTFFDYYINNYVDVGTRPMSVSVSY